jgi:hypothetical protein
LGKCEKLILGKTIYITAFISGSGDRKRLSVVVDGTLASGAGQLPPTEEAYVRSMDSTSGYNLDNFAKALVWKLKAALKL